jgi:hypothetical protein
MLVGALAFTLSGFRPVQAKGIEDARLAEKARVSIAKLGVGKDARVEIKLRDNTRVKGYISLAEEDSFTVTDSRTGVSRTLAYGDVTKVSKQGNGFSTMTKVLIGAAAVVGAVVVWQVVKPALCDGGAQSRGPC